MNEKQLLDAAVKFYMKRFGVMVDPIDALKYYVREGQVLTNDRWKVNEIFHKEGLVDGGSKTVEDREAELEKELYDLKHQVYTPKARQVRALELRLEEFRDKYGAYKTDKPAPLKVKTVKLKTKKSTEKGSLQSLIKIATVRLNEAIEYIGAVEEGLRNG